MKNLIPSKYHIPSFLLPIHFIFIHFFCRFHFHEWWFQILRLWIFSLSWPHHWQQEPGKTSAYLQSGLKTSILWLLNQAWALYAKSQVKIDISGNSGNPRVVFHLAKIFRSTGWNAHGHVDQNKISRTKWTTFGGTPVFPFQLLKTEITVTFAQNFDFHFVVSLRYQVVFWAANEKFATNGKKHFHFTFESSQNSRPKL